VPIDDFGGAIDVHLYADTDGWLVAYFKADEPAAKIMQWLPADVNNPQIATIPTTTLRDALTEAGDAAGVGILPEVRYYDFKFRKATTMTIFVKTRATDGANIAQVKIPADYRLYEASYYHYIYYDAWYSREWYWDSKLKVDERIVSDAVTSYDPPRNKWWRAFGSYGAGIVTGTLHKIEISYESHGENDIGSAGVATVLIYKTAR